VLAGVVEFNNHNDMWISIMSVLIGMQAEQCHL